MGFVRYTTLSVKCGMDVLLQVTDIYDILSLEL
jgi:hypothetical protein